MFSFSHSCVIFVLIFDIFLVLSFCFLEVLFTRSCPAVLACPRYPLNALYEKAVCLRCDGHSPVV